MMGFRTAMSGPIPLRTFGALVALIAFAACHGPLLEPPKPNSQIVADVVDGPYMDATTKSNPYLTLGSFSVLLSEGNYTAQFGASIDSYTATTTGPCYTVSMNASGNIATFTPTNATAIAGSSQANPCSIPASDLEGALFNDQNGHAIQVYFERIGTLGTPNALTETYASVALNTTQVTPQSLDATPTPAPGATLPPFTVTVTSTATTTGPFTASIFSWTAGTSTPCFVISQTTPGQFNFTAATPAPATAGTSSSCTVYQGADTEGVVFSDGSGDYNEQFFVH